MASISFDFTDDFADFVFLKYYPIFDSVIQGFLSKDGELTINNYELLFADKIFLGIFSSNSQI